MALTCTMEAGCILIKQPVGVQSVIVELTC